LVRLVGRVREEARQRLWDTLAGLPTRSQARQLEGLLEVARGARVSDLDRLRKGPVTASGKSMVTALDRVAEITAFGLGSFNLGAVPRRRLMELSRYGMAGKATLLRRHPRPGSWRHWSPPSCTYKPRRPTTPWSCSTSS
jgi:hypothetical protein